MSGASTVAVRPNRATILDALRLLRRDHYPFELRVLRAGRYRTVSGYFDDLDAAAEAAVRWNGEFNVYFTLNVIEPQLLARRHNRAEPYADTTTGDGDVVGRIWWPIDVDPVRPADTPASDDQHFIALSRAEQIRRWLIEQGVRPDAIVSGDSGNGGNLLVAIDEPNDPATLDLLRRATAVTDLVHGDDAARVDQSVCNAARLWKVPGTVSRKGDHTSQYPHRIAQLIDVPGTLTVSSRQALETIAALHPVDPEPDPFHADTRFDLPAFIQRHGINVSSTKSWAGGMAYVLQACPWHPEHTDRSAYVVQFSSGGLSAGCHHNSCEGKGWRDLRGLFEPGVYSDAAAMATSPGPGNEWPRLEELAPETPAVPQLPEELVPPQLLPWLGDAAERAAIPLEFVVVPAIVGLSGVVGRAIGIRPKRADDWLVVPNLWGGIVGRPGVMKSAAVAEATRPVRRLSAQAREEYEQDIVVVDAQRADLEFRIGALKDSGKKAAKADGDASEIARKIATLQAEMRNAVPVERRYLTQDATVEKLGELLRDNPRGLLLLRDELAGWLNTLHKPGREGEREFYLEAWNGDGSFTYDRIGRGTIHIPALTLALLGTIQPGKLRAYVGGALRGSIEDDGLLQRLQLLVWPDSVGLWINVDRFPDSTARDRAFSIFQHLDRLDPAGLGARIERDGDIPALRFVPDAQALFDAWRSELECRLRSVELHGTPAFEAHLAKYRSLMPSLALLFHLIEYIDVSTAGSGGSVGGVSLQAAQQAADWCDYLEQHARKVYADELHPGRSGAHRLAERIRQGVVRDGTSLREIYRRELSGLESQEAVLAAVSGLEAVGWCRLEETAPGERGGRPSQLLRIHPDLKEAGS